MITDKQIVITQRLLANHDFIKNSSGDEWSQIVAEQRGMIEDLMKAKSESALQVVLPIAKEMSADGENPQLILAVAVEISIGENS